MTARHRCPHCGGELPEPDYTAESEHWYARIDNTIPTKKKHRAPTGDPTSSAELYRRLSEIDDVD